MAHNRTNRGAAALGRYLSRTGRSQRDLALELGVDVAQICRWIQGEHKPGRAAAAQLAAVCNIKASAWDEYVRRAA